MEKMRVLFISYGSVFSPFLPGGGALRIHKFASFLSQRQKVEVVTGNFPRSDSVKAPYNLIFLGDGKNIYRSLFSFSLNIPIFTRKNSSEYDIIIDDYSPFYFSLAPIFHKNSVIQFQIYIGKHNIKRFPFPINIFFWGNENLYPKIFKKAISVQEYLIKVFGFDVPGKKYKVIWNGVDKENFQYKSEEENFILYCGRISEYMKGIDILFDALRKIKNFLENKKIYLAVVGDGPDRRKYEAISERLNLPVKFFGWISDKHTLSRFYSRCLFSVLPSRYEGFGLSILEAASFSKTSIISNIPAFSWAKHFCLTFQTGDSDSLAKKIIYLIENPEERRYLGYLGRIFSEDKTWDIVSHEFEKALLSFL